MLKASPIVSIITPTYNRGHLLPQLWNSLKAQTLQNFEWIIVDDGSTDNTDAVVENFNDPRIAYVWQENQGCNAARDHGLRLSRSEFVVYIDSDDVFYDDQTLESMVETLKQLPNTIIAAAFTDITDAGRLDSFIDGECVIANHLDILKSEKVSGSFFYIFRDSVKTLAPWPKYFGGELLYILRIAHKYPIAYFNRPGLIYNQRFSGLCSAESAIQRAPQMVKVITEILCDFGSEMRRYCPSQLGVHTYNRALSSLLAYPSIKALPDLLQSFLRAPWSYKFKALILLFFSMFPLSLRRYFFVMRSKRWFKFAKHSA